MKAAIPFAVIFFAFLALPAASMGLSDAWHVIEIVDQHACYRSTALPDSDGRKVVGTFNTFREAGMWEWGHRSICHRIDLS